MSVSRYRPNKFFIPGLSEIWKGQPPLNQDRSSRDRIKKKQIYKAYDHESFAPLRMKNKKLAQTSKKKKDMLYSFEDRKDKVLGSYRYFDDKFNSSRKQLDRIKARDRSSFLQSYRPTSRTSRNASTSRIEQSFSKDSYRKLTNRSKLQLEIQTASRGSEINPNDQIKMAKQFYSQGKINEAEKIFKQLLSDQSSPLECHYFLGVIALRRNEYSHTIEHLTKIVESNETYKKSTYLFLSMAYKGISDIENSFKIVNKGLESFPMYIDLLMYRGKLFMSNKNYEQADKDYTTVIGMKNNHTEAYFKKAECLVEMNALKKAITILTTLMYIDDESRAKILNQRAQLLFKINHIEQCKKDIEKLIEMKVFSSELYELKAVIEEREGRITESILCYEQSIRLNTSKRSIEKSLIGITKFKIHDLDYYSAHHQICRSNHLGIKSHTIEMYRLFTEGAVFLMKRKTQEGVNNFNTLLKEYILSNKVKSIESEDYQEHVDYLLKRFYVYRAYGYFVLGKHELSILDYTEGQKYTPIQRHSRYNLTLAEGIVEIKNRNFMKGYSLFEKAKTIYPNRIQPLLYKAVALVEKSYCEEIDEINRLEAILSALKELDTAYDINSNHSNLLFLRTLLYYCLGKINEGLQSISRAMAKSEENVPKYFYYRGIGNGSLGNYKQSQNDFTIVVNLDNQFAEAYFERAKTLFILNNPEKGLQDIDHYIKLRPSLDRYYIEGCLYFSIQDFQIALLKYEKAEDNQDTIIMKVKSYICIGELKFALNSLEGLDHKEYLGDITVLRYLINNTCNTDVLEEYLQLLNENVNISHKVFNSVQIYHYIGAIYFQLCRFKEAEEEFKKAYKERQFLNIQYMINGEEYENEEAAEESQLEMNQLNYNLFLCHLMGKDMKKAHELFIRQILPVKDMIPQGEILTELCEMIFLSVKGVDENEQIVNELEITMFNNPLSDNSPSIVLKLKNGQLKTKLCNLLPSIIVKQMRPEVNQKKILSIIQMTEVENKPEPPWVRRNDESTLIFTGEIQDVGIEFETEENKETEEEEEQKTEEEYESSHYSTEEGKETNKKIEIEKLKNAFKLNESIERKLNTFIKNNK